MDRVSSSFLRTIAFSKFDKWDTKRYTSNFGYNFDNEVRLSEILSQHRETISKEDLVSFEYSIIAKINFGGELFLRDKGQTADYKGKLFLVPDDSIIYSKINVRHGCVYHHERNATPFAVSSEYPVFKYDKNRVNGAFIKMVLRSEPFKRILNTKTSGISKARVKVDEFLDISIPLPPLLVQNEIVKSYQAAHTQANQLEQEALELQKSIEDLLYNELGINEIVTDIKKKFRTIPFKEVDRWSVDTLGKLSKVESRFHGKYPLVRLASLIESYQYGLSEKSSKEKIGPPMLRMNNILNSELNTRDLKYITIDEKTLSKYQLNNGDLLFNRTNSKELVGKTAVFDRDEEYTFASYLIRVVVDSNKADVNYINYLFNSSILQYQKDLVSRQITGQANINAQEMQTFLFPIPPIDKQIEIVGLIDAAKIASKKASNKAVDLREKAIKNFEQKVFND